MRLIECILPVIAVLSACGGEGDKGLKIPAPEAYTTMKYCFNGTSIVSNLDKYGIIDTLGNILLPLRYDNITYITDELAAAQEKGLYWAQRKISVVLHFPLHRHKASGAALGLSCAVCFEQPAGVFAGCGAVC